MATIETTPRAAVTVAEGRAVLADGAGLSLERLYDRRPRLSWPRTVKPYLMVGDMAVVLAVLTTFPSPTLPAAVVTGAGVLATLAGVGSYRARLSLSVLDDLPALLVAALVGTIIDVAWLTLHGQESSSSTHLMFFAVLGTLLILARSLAYVVVRTARRMGLIQHRTLILGAGEVGRQLARATLAHPEYGLHPIGILDAAPVADAERLPVPLLGTYADLVTTIRREGISEVIVAFTTEDSPASTEEARHDVELVDTVRACDRFGCEIFCVPRFYELHHRSRDMDEVWGIPLVRARRATWRSGTWRLKRVFDVVASAAALIVLSPLLLALMVAVRRELGPGVLFRQVRVGLDGEPFTLLKFRSLPTSSPAAEPTAWSVDGDSRLGPVGRFIRATSLDELPQLVNVLRGEMSIVGPRPERPTFVDEFTQAVPRYTARHRAPAGLTGWAQVNGLRGDTSIAERVRFDNYYIQNWSLWFDAKIIVRTISSVLLRRGS